MDFPNSDTETYGSFRDKLHADKSINDFVKHEKMFNQGQLSVQDPVYLGFHIFFDWFSSPLFKSVLGPKDGNLNGPFETDSAAGYLNRIGEKRRIAYLQAFASRLQYINTYTPFYWQSIEGLENIWQIYNTHKSSYMGGDESKITLNTLESLDMTIAGLMDMYRSILHDRTYNRVILPSNLRSFDMYIYVKDIRKFHSIDKDSDAQIKGPTTQFIESIENNPFYILKLSSCKFRPIESNSIWSSVNNSSAEPASNKLTITYKSVEIVSNTPWFNGQIEDNNPNKDKISSKLANSTYREGPLDRLEKRVKFVANSTIRGIKNTIKEKTDPNYLFNRIVASNLGLLNVYGKSTQFVRNLQSATSSTNITNIAENLFKNDNRFPSIVIPKNEQNPSFNQIGSFNVYPTTSSPDETLNSVDIIEPNDTESYEQLNSENVHNNGQ